MEKAIGLELIDLLTVRKTQHQAVASYVVAYGDPQSIMKLCKIFDLNWAKAGAERGLHLGQKLN